ncbi:MAG: hypothetical protein K9L85_03890 [Candidatus Peribacteraceae bacterium]|nr:hypothetical protein [Candidatus Gracilibacteria bacterium]MCF7846354.1 hypothetical protein [Candidatus Peribacteraceae bacterium]
MPVKRKRRIAQTVLIAFSLAVIFLPIFTAEKLRAYLNISTTGDYETEIIWGQAYSPNVGWINFYCDGAGNTRPAGAPATGAAAMSDSCGSIPYSVTYDPTAGSPVLTGFAYSTNYGWLDMSKVKMSFPAPTLKDIGLEAKSDGKPTFPAAKNYYFGTTYFQINTPNSYGPGVKYYNDLGYFCGFAYSDQVGYISFCDPQTKEKSPKNVSVPGYDWDTYAVYMGLGESLTVPGNPTTTAVPKVFAAIENYPDEVLVFQDDAADIQSITVKITDSVSTKTFNTLIDVDPVMKKASVEITGLDFHIAGNYALQFTACDYSGNCTDPDVEGDGKISNFFQVVATVPNSSNSKFSFGSPVKVADGDENHFVRVELFDQFDNPVKSVAGIKEVKANFSFVNTTKLDQIAGTGDSAIFTAIELSPDKEGGTSTGYLTELAAGSDGKFQVDVKSFAPTSDGYDPIADDGFKLWFEKITSLISALGGYTNVGEIASPVVYGSTDESRKFGFKPALTATPEALVWDNATNTYDGTDPDDGVNNITVNAVKRFNVDFANYSSSKDVTDLTFIPRMDVAGSEIAWDEDAVKAEIPVELDLVPVQNAPNAGSTWNQLDELDGDLLTTEDKINPLNIVAMRLQGTPILTSETEAPNSSDLTFKTYIGYSINGKSVKHKGEELTPPATETEPQLISPTIDIGGKKFLRGQKSLDLVEARNKLKTAISKATQAFLYESTGCSSDLIITTKNEFNNTGCDFQKGHVVYVDGADVTLGDGTNPLTLPSGANTLIIRGGNLNIRSNLQYGTAGDTFGIIVLNNEVVEKGHVYVYPNVTNVVGAVYSDDSLTAVNYGGETFEDATATCDSGGLNDLGFCDRSYEIHNQLYLKGLFATNNTVGGSDQDPVEFPPDMSNTQVAIYQSAPDGGRAQARIYDLAYLRNYHLGSGGTPAIGAPSGDDDAVIVEGDNNLLFKPPSFFEGVNSVQMTELGQ